ncbi:NUDIX hydrolase [Leekyejoonella antrihumi]|uniref:NUDIX domain-containing protein n=1 Tax=Leekyejoonella antrihumi TaxID=1660198 RepID=A0A563DVD7_9MICO|nr:NUDIX domain-containing protein [Leekyejoonella antrihumi]TWP33892.1 NUDIX domain-containing protein [Leekyejoonella antrihumi]
MNSHDTVVDLVTELEPLDHLADAHRQETLDWLAETKDIWRRRKPATPDPHLVSYFLLVDSEARQVLLCDHRLSGLWLPTGGHVEVGEHPADTVRREAGEELGIAAQFDAELGERPFLVTITETAADPPDRHTDVSLWFALTGAVGMPLVPDPREFQGVRWWTPAQIHAEDPSHFDPHTARALRRLGLD